MVETILGITTVSIRIKISEASGIKIYDFSLDIKT